VKPPVLAAGVAAWIALSVALAKALKLHNPDFWILVGGLAFIGILAALVLWYFAAPKSSASPAAAPPDRAHEKSDLDALLREADARLAKSQLGAGVRLSTLPVFFVLGERSATKTTVVLNSGLEPELIGGQVYRDNNQIPTQLANVWFARKSLLLEAGPDLLNEPKAWNSLIGRLLPGRLATVRETQQAPRAVLVCFDTETFFRPDGLQSAAGIARKLHARLNEMSQTMGISFPVYVLFTRADRVSFFLDYVANFTAEEASQVFGVTLESVTRDATAIYAEGETIRLGKAFDTLFFSLADKRPEYLSREHDPAKLRGVYEFPRQFNKLRDGVVAFLLELGRPSQLSFAPFLRGFYFTGVRPVVVTQNVAPVARREPEQARLRTPDATSIFNPARFDKPAVEPQPEIVQRRVPQWVFLGHFFTDVLLADRTALAASSASSRTSLARRVGLGIAAAACLLYAAALTVSFFENRGLENRVLAAAGGIPAGAASGADLPSLDSLARLDHLRESLSTLSAYRNDGAPLSFRWGLYSGNAMLPPVRRLYFQKFDQLLLQTTESHLVANLAALPLAPQLNDDYQFAYDTLKSYLITTSNHDKSTPNYLAPVLVNRWLGGRTIDAARLDLVKRQFEFYSQELKAENPYSSANDAATVEHARRYLSKFAGAERVYQFMLSEVNKANKTINFNGRFPGSAQTVIDSYDVAGAFTKSGWAAMTDDLKHIDRFFNGEQWVLGDQSSGDLDLGKLQTALTSRYTADFLGAWRTYLKRAAIVPYKSVPDAAQKLRTLSSPESPLLELFWLASQNTAASNPKITAALKPLYSVMPPNSGDQLIVPANDAYMKDLAALQIAMDQMAQQPGTPSDAAASQTQTSAQNALLVTRQMAQNFGRDADAHLEATVEKLMEDPITYSQSLLRGLGPAELNGKGKGLCAQLSSLFTKIPFNPRSKTEAAVSDVNSFFKPKEGALWTFYDANLSKYLVPQGSIYVPDPGAPIRLAGAFVNFFNRAAAFSQMAYPNGSADPHFTYNVRPLLSEDIASLKLTIDGQSAEFTAASPAKAFSWQASGPHGVQLSGRFKDGTDLPYPTYDGLWSVFEWVSDADSQQGSTLEWKLKAGVRDRAVLSPVTGQPVVVRFNIDNPVFAKNYFAEMACTAEVAKP
jgi:type VI secretion system protein ImpL